MQVAKGNEDRCCDCQRTTGVRASTMRMRRTVSPRGTSSIFSGASSEGAVSSGELVLSLYISQYASEESLCTLFC